MRSRDEIEKDLLKGAGLSIRQDLMMELLLDIREILQEMDKRETKLMELANP